MDSYRRPSHFTGTLNAASVCFRGHLHCEKSKVHHSMEIFCQWSKFLKRPINYAYPLAYQMSVRSFVKTNDLSIFWLWPDDHCRILFHLFFLLPGISPAKQCCRPWNRITLAQKTQWFNRMLLFIHGFQSFTTLSLKSDSWSLAIVFVPWANDTIA